MDDGDKYLWFYIKLLAKYVDEDGVIEGGIKRVRCDLKVDREFCENAIGVLTYYGLVKPCGRGVYVLADYINNIVKSGKTAKRGSPEYAFWRKSVFTRDGFVCQRCGVNGKRIEAHHISPWALDREHRYDVNNGITLCTDCHKAEHKKMGRIRRG